MTYRRSPDELERDLGTQVQLMRRAARSFDEGDLAEYLNLAVRIRVLLHDTRASASLLSQLGIKQGLMMVDTVVPDRPDNLLAWSGLTLMQITTGENEGAAWVAPLDDLSPRRVKPPIPFEIWWNAPVVRDNQPAEFSRRDLVLAVANQEGGAHVDPEMDESAARFARSNTLGITFTGRHSERDPKGPVPPSIRQIAYEVLTTIERERPDI